MLRIVFIVWLMWSGSAQALTARQSLLQFSKNLYTAQTFFSQDVSGPNGETVQHARGSLSLQSPNLFRWQYTEPNVQLIIADGKKIWMYDPDLQQVTVRSQDALNQDNPLSILAKPEQIDRFYEVSELPNKQGMQWLQLVPKNKQNAPFERAWLGFVNTNLHTMQLFDTLGQVSEFHFSAWQKNSAIAPEAFRFVVPKGVDVVE